MVRFTRIVIIIAANNIYIFVARIPVESIRRFVRCPHPNQVVESFLVHKEIKHKFVQSDARFCSVSTPPEPLAASFVKRAPKNSDTFFLQGQKRIGNHFHIAHNSFVFIAFCFPFVGRFVVSLGNAEFGVRSVSARLCIERFNFVHRVFPMPVELRDAASLPYGFCHFERCVRVTLEPQFL